MSKKVVFLLLLAALLVTNISPNLLLGVAFGEANIRNFYVAAEYDIGGSGYNMFYPQTLVFEQGDQINITVRNAGNESFQLNIEGQNSIAIQPGEQNNTELQPVDTPFPIFIASTAGIFSFNTDKFPEMNGQIVVLPALSDSYNPNTQTRTFTELVLPDFAGEGYDKFFPGVMVVNQGDTVNVSIRNTDDMPHGFAIAAYGINVAVNPGQDQPDGSTTPFVTSVQAFNASKPGIFSFLCTTPCGPGHFEMVGQLFVIPTRGTTYAPDIQTKYSYLTIKPDFAGDGYDKYVPSTIIVNQGDLVYIKVRNTDGNVHGFSLPNFGVNNETIAGAQNTTGELIPTDTYMTAFFADQPGVYEFFCTIYCGPGHDQMNGYLVVLPIQNSTSSTSPPQTGSGISLFLLVLTSLAILILGILIGIIIAVKFK